MNIDKIYELRKSYTIIALTGRKGSGCSMVAERLAKGFDIDSSVFRHPNQIDVSHNSYRKYRIVYNYAKENFQPHILISYRDILLLFILRYNFENFTDFLGTAELEKEFEATKLKHLCDFRTEVSLLEPFKSIFDELHTETLKIFETEKSDKSDALRRFIASPKFLDFASALNGILETKSKVKRSKLLQVIGNNIRRSGKYFDNINLNLANLFDIAEVINDIIKSYSKKNGKKQKPTEIVINSLRNPLEIMFFRQRFSAFYTIAVNRTENLRKMEISKLYSKDLVEDIEKLMTEEYKGGQSKDFYKQNVSQCIQNSDIHLAFKDYDEIDSLNNIHSADDNVSPYFSWQMQLLKYLSLIDQPGIVTPSPEERCMQLAFTAKYNSGCISRQVGASITDANYAIKAIGWNNTPEGQVPCSLRNVEDLLNETGDMTAFTSYERNNPEFKVALQSHYRQQIQEHKDNLKGRNVCFCFKSLINSYSEGKNQVHTRSLHAEESAFLQITKYGGQGIQHGKLFTTASPCELCSKKAYQLGIRVIYYIDPYPGISFEHILTAGHVDRNPTMRLFHGAIGNAYHWLYEPFISYKDELAMILNQEIKDLATIKGEQLSQKTKELIEKEASLDKLQKENDELWQIIASKLKE